MKKAAAVGSWVRSPLGVLRFFLYMRCTSEYHGQKHYCEAKEHPRECVGPLVECGGLGARARWDL